MTLLLLPVLVGFSNGETRAYAIKLPITQIDYEPFLTPVGPHGLPVLNLTAVDYDKSVVKTHDAVVLENEFLHVTLLPAMGRVYRVVYKVTGHDALWKNDIARPGGANNVLGWWLWIGGMEYTLPGEEHGVTWAMEWTWSVAANSTDRVAIKATVTEPQTGLVETLVWSLSAGSAALATDVDVSNPATNPNQSLAYFAHWTNPQMAPGGTNELDDDTEFFIPTRAITVPQRWQADLGPSPQAWKRSALRFLRGWKKMGDIDAVTLEAAPAGVVGRTNSYHASYNHGRDEGVARVFDATKTPGLDTWTYGFRPARGVVPMGSGATSAGYAEMWGGTVTEFPDARGTLAPGKSLSWREALLPFVATGGGLDYASERLAVHATFSPTGSGITVWICAVQTLRGGAVELWQDGAFTGSSAAVLLATPASPFTATLSLGSEEGSAGGPIQVLVWDETSAARRDLLANVTVQRQRDAGGVRRGSQPRRAPGLEAKGASTRGGKNVRVAINTWPWPNATLKAWEVLTRSEVRAHSFFALFFISHSLLLLLLLLSAADERLASRRGHRGLHRVRGAAVRRLRRVRRLAGRARRDDARRVDYGRRHDERRSGRGPARGEERGARRAARSRAHDTLASRWKPSERIRA